MLAQAAGYVGAWALAMCAFPLMMETIIRGHADGINTYFLFLWLMGEICMLYHVVATGASMPLILNYAANALMVSVVGVYKICV